MKSCVISVISRVISVISAHHLSTLSLLALRVDTHNLRTLSLRVDTARRKTAIPRLAISVSWHKPVVSQLKTVS